MLTDEVVHTPNRPVDPFASAVDGVYEDEVIVVSRTTDLPEHVVRTRHFSTWYAGGRVHLAHRLRPELVNNDLAALVAQELFTPGWLSGPDVFERAFTGLVLTSADTSDDAWELFYRNTLGKLDDLEEYGPVYEHACTLVRPGTALELGCCFGFLSLRLAGLADVTATDVTNNTVRLLRRVAPRLGRRLATLVCDAARVPAPDRSYDTVLAVHLLEHLQLEHGASVMAEMLRLARRRVVVAVPFEDEPTAAYGHVRTFDLADLRALAPSVGWDVTCYEHHGGWLILDRRS